MSPEYSAACSASAAIIASSMPPTKNENPRSIIGTGFYETICLCRQEVTEKVNCHSCACMNTCDIAPAIQHVARISDCGIVIHVSSEKASGALPIMLAEAK